jgi:hypothetical protein
MILKTKFGRKWEEIIGGWKILHNQELQNLYSSPAIIRVTKSRRTRWAGQSHLKEGDH